MKIFLSWSGQRSKATAELLSEWIRCVIQASRPWISARDIDRGALWFSEINDQLKEVTVGIVCLTQANKAMPWILFEAGALAKGLASSRVCTFLVDLQPSDIVDPLAQFNHTLPERDSMRQLVRTLNASCGQASLDERVLDQVFETYWPQFEERFADLLSRNPDVEKTKPRDDKSLLTEILETTRMMNQRIRRIEMAEERAGKISYAETGMITSAQARVLIQTMLADGLEPVAILEKLRTSAPPSWVKREIEKQISGKDSGESETSRSMS